MTPVKAVIRREIVGSVSCMIIPRNAAGQYAASILSDDGQHASAKPTCISQVTGDDTGLSHYLIPLWGDKENTTPPGQRQPQPVAENSGVALTTERHGYGWRQCTNGQSALAPASGTNALA